MDKNGGIKIMPKRVPLLPIAPDKWRSLGAVTFPKQKPVFPEDPANPNKAEVPGIYLLVFDNGYVYVGQTGRLRGRFGDYHTPTQGTEHEHVMHYILLDARDAKVEVKVKVFTEGDLSEESTRLGLEAYEKDAAKKAKHLLLNEGGRGHGHYLRFKIEYHKDMLEKATAELQSWNLNAQKRVSNTV